MHRHSLVAVLALAAATNAQAVTPQPPPPARIATVTDNYAGHVVRDPYRWMEIEPEPAFEHFLHAQDDYARAELARLPDRDALRAAIAADDGQTVAISDMTLAGGRLFYLRRDPDAETPRLVMRDASGRETVLADPASFAEGGTHAEIDQFAPSLDGRLIAYGVSTGGSEKSVLHIMRTDDRRPWPETIDRAQFAAVSWAPDGGSFFYARLQAPDPHAPPADAYSHIRVYRHVPSTDPAADPVVLDADHLPFPVQAPQRFPSLVTTPGSPWALAQVSDGVSPEVALFAAPVASLGKPRVPWRLVASQSDDVTGYTLRGSRIDLLTHKDAPHLRIVETDLDHPDLAEARVVVRQGSGVITALALASDALYLARRDGAVMTLLRLADGARLPDVVTLPFAGSIQPPVEDSGGLVADPTRPGADFSLESWMQPLAWLHYDPGSHAVVDLGLVPPYPHDLRAYQTVETAVRAHDGTLIPLSIVRRRDAPNDGRRPVLLDGYGAYGISLDPSFSPQLLPWLDRGGIFAVAHVRGGGEGGYGWHEGGKLATKMNTITDFLACAHALIDRHLTDRAHLAGMGTSAGGILIGGAITHEPDLFRAALIRVGAIDTLREEFTQNGPSNIPEFGTVKDPADVPYMLAMDAYQQVRDGVAYPAVLLTGGSDDPRVPVWEPAKMAARLQHASSSGRPVLLRVEFDAGHGIGSTRSQHDAEVADEFAFLLWQMGEPGFQPKP